MQLGNLVSGRSAARRSALDDDGAHGSANLHNPRPACPAFEEAFRFGPRLLDRQLHQLCGDMNLLTRVGRQSFCRKQSILKRR